MIKIDIQNHKKSYIDQYGNETIVEVDKFGNEREVGKGSIQIDNERVVRPTVESEIKQNTTGEVKKIQDIPITESITPKSSLKLNIGCNQWKLDGFLNIDIDPVVNPDMVCDATNLPFKDGYFDEIFAGHIIEHIDSSKEPLKEWSRVLKQGGKITIVVTNPTKALEMFDQGLITYSEIKDIIFGATDRQSQRHLEIYTTKRIIDEVSKYFKEVKIVETSLYLVADVQWQTIIEAIL